MSARFSEMKQTSFVVVVAMAENLVQQPDVQEEWDGMTVLQVSMDAVCREQPM